MLLLRKGSDISSDTATDTALFVFNLILVMQIKYLLYNLV